LVETGKLLKPVSRRTEFSMFHHDRQNYLVYVCQNEKCPYYLKNKRTLAEDKSKLNPVSSGNYKLKYSYREFKFTLDDVKHQGYSFETKVDLDKIQSSQHILGLILTYHINYGMSTRKTAQIMKDIHNVVISHQTVANYCEAVAAYTQHIVERYPYKLSNGLCGDETYVKIRGKTHYVFFFSDIKTKIILAYKIFKNRDTLNAVKSIFMAINKYKEIPEGFHIVTDGNPIYNAAQLFFHLNGVDFDLHQVIGVTNKDEQSAQWRSYKQIEERLNRTYKQNYYGTNGYDNLKTANIYMVLYVAFFNFLRRHSSLDFKPPVDDGLFDENDLMPIKWLKLINLSKQYLNA
jgi:transposase-like protein